MPEKPSQSQLDLASRFIKDVGFPIAAFLALGWVGVSYWIAPQNAAQEDQRKQAQQLIDVLAKGQDQTLETNGLLHSAVAQNGQMIGQVNSQLQTVTTMMEWAKDTMEEVPQLREEQLRILEDIRDQLKAQGAAIPAAPPMAP